MPSRKPAALVCLLVAGALAVISACGSDDLAAPRTSRRGEACRVSADCADGLACAPIPGGAGGRCVTGEFHVRPTAKDCAVVECAGATDCCDGTDAQACAGAIDCQLGACVFRCSSDKECTAAGAGRHCTGGKCVRCALDTECSDGKQCVNGACQPRCENDGDCGGFDRCVEGRCIPSGCQADRECVAATRNVDARCGTDGKCIVPCETDLECGNPTDYAFFSCIEKECTYVGCESDKDCRIFLFGASDASTLGPKQHAVCRDRGLIGDVTKPAR